MATDWKNISFEDSSIIVKEIQQSQIIEEENENNNNNNGNDREKIIPKHVITNIIHNLNVQNLKP